MLPIWAPKKKKKKRKKKLEDGNDAATYSVNADRLMQSGASRIRARNLAFRQTGQRWGRWRRRSSPGSRRPRSAQVDAFAGPTLHRNNTAFSEYLFYDPKQPRDERGRWTSTGGKGKSISKLEGSSPGRKFDKRLKTAAALAVAGIAGLGFYALYKRRGRITIKDVAPFHPGPSSTSQDSTSVVKDALAKAHKTKRKPGSSPLANKFVSIRNELERTEATLKAMEHFMSLDAEKYVVEHFGPAPTVPDVANRGNIPDSIKEMVSPSPNQREIAANIEAHANLIEWKNKVTEVKNRQATVARQYKKLVRYKNSMEELHTSMGGDERVTEEDKQRFVAGTAPPAPPAKRAMDGHAETHIKEMDKKLHYIKNYIESNPADIVESIWGKKPTRADLMAVLEKYDEENDKELIEEIKEDWRADREYWEQNIEKVKKEQDRLIAVYFDTLRAYNALRRINPHVKAPNYEKKLTKFGNPKPIDLRKVKINVTEADLL